MKHGVLVCAAGLILGATTAASAVEVHKRLEVAGNPEDVWRIASEFCSIKTWHPGFSDCTQKMENGAVWRVLTLREGGGKITEKLTDVDDVSYSYVITESPLPIQNYKAKLGIEKAGAAGQTTLRWDASFDVKDAAETDKMAKLLDDVLGAGLQNIKALAAKSANCK